MSLLFKILFGTKENSKTKRNTTESKSTISLDSKSDVNLSSISEGIRKSKDEYNSNLLSKMKERGYSLSEVVDYEAPINKGVGSIFAYNDTLALNDEDKCIYDFRFDESTIVMDVISSICEWRFDELWNNKNRGEYLKVAHFFELNDATIEMITKYVEKRYRDAMDAW